MLAGTELVFDVNVIPDSVHYGDGVELDGAFYFYAESDEHDLPNGYNLWKYDPDANGGQGEAEPLSRDFIAGSYDFWRDIIVFDGKIFFSAGYRKVGHELWSYDPATNQFTQASNLYDGQGSSAPAQFAILNDRLYFLATDITRKRAIVEFDPNANNGAGATTTLAYLANSEPRWMEPLGNRLYFSYDDEVSGIGEELWYFEVAAGGGSGTFGLVADIHQGQYDASISDAIAWNDKLYFSAYDGTIRQLREYDPLANDGEGGLRTLTDSQNGGFLNYIGDFAVLDDQLYFRGYDPLTHSELWRYDPITDTAEIVIDKVIGGSGLQPEKITSLGGKLYFQGFTQSYTVALFCFDPAANDGLGSIDQVNIPGGFNSYDIPLTTFDGKLVFIDREVVASGPAIWGPALFDPEGNNGTGEFIFLPYTWNDTQSSKPTHMLEVNGKYYFQAYEDSTNTELWQYDPAASLGVESVRRITGETVRGVKEPYLFDGKIYFAGYDVTHAEELWVFDPSANDGEGALSLVADIATGNKWGSPSGFTEVAGKLYFSAYDASFDQELYVFDPDANGGLGEVRLAADIRPDGPSAPRRLTSFQGKLFFAAYDGVTGVEVWVYDPTANGGIGAASPLTDLYPGWYSSDPKDLTPFNGKLYFTADDDTHGYELWEYDPLASGDPLQLVADIDKNRDDGSPTGLLVLNGQLYFTATNGVTGEELWVFDPTSNTVSQVADVAPGSADFLPDEKLVFDGKLYMVGSGPDGEKQLWVYDPAANEGAGTISQVDLNYSEGSLTDLAKLWTFGGKIYLTAFDINYGHELFVYDPNQFPVAMDDAYAAVEDTPLTIDATAGVLSNDSEIGDGPLVISVTTNASHGVLVLNDDGSFTYTPEANYNGSDSFVYEVRDRHGDVATGTVQLTIASQNDPAVIGGDTSGTTDEDAMGALAGVLAISDVDPGEEGFVTQTGTAGTYGIFVLDANGNWGYSLDTNSVQSLAVGSFVSDVFTVESSDGTQQTVTIQIDGRNDVATLGGSLTGNVQEDGALAANGTATIVDIDQGESTFLAQVDATGVYGTFSIAANGNWTYSLDNASIQILKAGQEVVDTFTIESLDGGSSQQVSITITGANDAAVIGGDTSGTTDEDTANGASGVLNVSDVDQGESEFQPQTDTAGSYGAFSIDANGNWVYVLDTNSVQNLAAGSSVNDTFSVESVDGTQQLVVITINGLNDVPVITGDVVGSVSEDDVVTASGSASVADVDQGESVFLAQSFSTTYGSFSIDFSGNWTYNLNSSAVQFLAAGQMVTDTATIQSLDGSASQEVSITITGNNDLAVFGGDTTAETDEDTADGPTGMLTVSDPDKGESEFVPQSESVGSYGAFSLAANGSWAYSVDTNSVQDLGAGSSATDSFLVESIDGGQQLVVITIHGQNDVPVITGDMARNVSEDGELFASGTVFITDIDQGESSFQAQSGSTTYGTFSVDANGIWTYNLNNSAVQFLALGQTVIDTATIVSLDGSGSHQISITIAGANDPSIIGGDVSGTTDEDTSLGASGTLTVSDTDQGESSFVAQANTIGTYGLFSLDASGHWAYTLATPIVQSLPVGSSFSDSFTVESVDGTQQTVTIQIDGRNDLPLLSIQSIDGYRYAGNTLSVTAWASDVDEGSDSFFFEYKVYFNGGDTPRFTGSGKDISSFDFTPDLAGEYLVVVIVSDSEWGMNSYESTVNVGVGSSIAYELVIHSSFDVGETDNSDAGSPETLHEWADATGELWLTIDYDLPEGPLDLSFDLQYTGTLWLDPQLGDHLGDASFVSTPISGGLASTLTLTGLDLSAYEVGDRVLLAKIIYPKNVDDLVGLPMNQGGVYPQPLSEHSIQLVSAEITSGGPALTADNSSQGKVAPVVYDANDDGKIGLTDFASFISNYGKQPGASYEDAYRFDYNQDGRVGVADFALFIRNYAKRKATADVSIILPPAITAPSPAARPGLLEAEPDPSIRERFSRELIVLEMFHEVSSTQGAELSYFESSDDDDLPEALPLFDHQTLDAQLFDAAVCEIALTEDTAEDDDLMAEMVLPIDWTWQCPMLGSGALSRVKSYVSLRGASATIEATSQRPCSCCSKEIRSSGLPDHGANRRDRNVPRKGRSGKAA